MRLCAAIVSVFLSLASAAAESPATVNLSGQWKLNPEQSDDARQKMHEAMEGTRPGGSGPGGGGPPMGGPGGSGTGGRKGAPGGGDPREALRSLVEASTELTITQTEPEIVIQEGDGRLRVLHPDGKKYKAEGGSAEVSARWEGALLRVEFKTQMGAKVTETFDLAANRSRMTVTLRLERSPMPTVTIKRVYEPADSKE